MIKKVIILMGLLVLFGSIIFSSYSYIKVKQWDSLILPKVKIENEDLTGKTKKEALIIINDKYSSNIIKKKIINVQLPIPLVTLSAAFCGKVAGIRIGWVIVWVPSLILSPLFIFYIENIRL